MLERCVLVSYSSLLGIGKEKDIKIPMFSHLKSKEDYIRGGSFGAWTSILENFDSMALGIDPGVK